MRKNVLKKETTGWSYVSKENKFICKKNVGLLKLKTANFTATLTVPSRVPHSTSGSPRMSRQTVFQPFGPMPTLRPLGHFQQHFWHLAI
jgi:hypothetical protein